MRRGNLQRVDGSWQRRGPVQAILQAERVGLSFVQRMSGIATLTAQYVAAVAGTRARIVDMRKQRPASACLNVMRSAVAAVTIIAIRFPMQ